MQKNRAFVEAANPTTNISGSWPTIQRGTSERFIIARGALQHNRSKRAPRATHSEITVINIVGLVPSQFIAEFCFLQRWNARAEFSRRRDFRERRPYRGRKS